MLKVIIIVTIILVILFGIYFFLNPDQIIPRSSLKGNMWILVNYFDKRDTSRMERDIWAHGEAAISELEKCVKKYTDKGQQERVDLCQGIIDWIRKSPPKKVD